jgi:hypothetical protein
MLRPNIGETYQKPRNPTTGTRLPHAKENPMRRLALTTITGALAALAFTTPAIAGSAHFVGTPVVSVSGSAITVSAKEAGLGDLTQIHVVLAGTASCINGGGIGPAAANKTTFTAAADEPVQNGHSDYTLTATAVFDPSSPCPDPMAVAFSAVTLTDTTNGLTEPVTMITLASIIGDPHHCQGGSPGPGCGT